MTLIQVIDAARSMLNEPLDSARTFPDNSSSYWADSTLTTYHNLVQAEIQNELISVFENFFVTQTTISFVNGVSDYALPTDFIQMVRVEDLRNNPNDPVEVLPITISRRGQRSAPLYISGASLNDGYYILGSRIFFGDTPSTSYASAVRTFYVQRLAEVTSASSISEIPQEYHQLLVWGIIKYALLQEQADTSKADTEYEKLIVKMRKQAEDRQIQRPRKVKIRQGII